MIKSTLFHLFLIINLFYSFSDCNHYFFPSFLTSLVATPVITGAISVPRLALHNALKKPLLSALKPSIVIGCGASSLGFCFMLIKESQQRTLGRYHYTNKDLANMAAGFAGGIGATTYFLLCINNWLIQRYGTQKTQETKI